MVIDVPATVSVLVRSAPVLTATVNAAVPLPVPLPVVNVTNAALLVAVQLHLLPAVTVMGAEPVPPSGPKAVVGCTTLNAHEGAVVAVSFLLHADAISEALTARPSAREKHRIMRAPPSTVERTLNSSGIRQYLPRPSRGRPTATIDRPMGSGTTRSSGSAHGATSDSNNRICCELWDVDFFIHELYIHPSRPIGFVYLSSASSSPASANALASERFR